MPTVALLRDPSNGPCIHHNLMPVTSSCQIIPYATVSGHNALSTGSRSDGRCRSRPALAISTLPRSTGPPYLKTAAGHSYSTRTLAQSCLRSVADQQAGMAVHTAQPAATAGGSCPGRELVHQVAACSSVAAATAGGSCPPHAGRAAPWRHHTGRCARCSPARTPSRAASPPPPRACAAPGSRCG